MVKLLMWHFQMRIFIHFHKDMHRSGSSCNPDSNESSDRYDFFADTNIDPMQFQHWHIGTPVLHYIEAISIRCPVVDDGWRYLCDIETIKRQSEKKWFISASDRHWFNRLLLIAIQCFIAIGIYEHLFFITSKLYRSDIGLSMTADDIYATSKR